MKNIKYMLVAVGLLGLTLAITPQDTKADGCTATTCWSSVLEVYVSNGPHTFVYLNNVGTYHTYGVTGCELVGDTPGYPAYFWIDKRYTRNASDWLSLLLTAKALNREVEIRYVPTTDWYDLDGDGSRTDLLCMVDYVVLTSQIGS